VGAGAHESAGLGEEAEKRLSGCAVREWTVDQLPDLCATFDELRSSFRAGCEGERDAFLRTLGPAAQVLQQLGDGLQFDWDSVAASLHIDCQGCEWLLLPYLLGRDAVLARVHTLSIVFYGEHAALGAADLQTLDDAMVAAGFSLLATRSDSSGAAHDPLLQLVQQRVWVARDAPWQVLYNMEAAVQSFLRPWRSMGGVDPALVARGAREALRVCLPLHVQARRVHVTTSWNGKSVAKGFLLFRYFEAALMLRRLAAADETFPDVEMVVCLEDETPAFLPNVSYAVTKREMQITEPMPAFAPVTCADSYSIPLPMANTRDTEGSFED
jgi:hypothetical protein